MATANTYEASLLEHYPREVLDPKGIVPAWAQARGDLAETLDYFRKTQGGVYYTDGFIRAVLLENFGGPRSHCDSEVVITRLYGSEGQKTDERTRKMMGPMAEQTLKEQHPVVLILGARNSNLEVDFSGYAAYCVMGSYFLTDVWYEKYGNTYFCQIRFEKTDLESTSWFASTKRPVVPSLKDRSLNSNSVMEECTACKCFSVRRYSEAFVCERTYYRLFSQVIGDATHGQLTYDKAYLTRRNQPQNPPSVELTPRRFDFALPNRDLWRGSVCPDCGKCVSRVHWSRWVCTGCGHAEVVLPNIPSKAQLLGEPPKQWRGKGKPICINDQNFIIRHDLKLRNSKRYNLHQYQFPNGIGNILFARSHSH